MVSVIKEKDAYHSDFISLEMSRNRRGSSWLDPIREAAMRRFKELGFPTTKEEEWRFTNVEPIARTPFRLSANGTGDVAMRDVGELSIEGLKGCQLVFVNGHYASRLSQTEVLAPGLTVTGLAQALQTDLSHRIQPHLAHHANYNDDAFTALNTAFIDDGAFIYVSRGVAVEQPIHLLFVSTGGADGEVAHPRNLVVAETGSQVTVIEDYVSLADGVYFTNAVTEVVVGEDANVTRYLIERESTRAYNVSTLEVHQARDSHFTSHSVLWGGALVRNNVHPVLDGEGCDTLLNGLYVASGQQLIDNHLWVEHAQPHGHSRQFYRGILDGLGRAVFSGRIVVQPDAQKTDANQSNMNLLLSEDAQINTKPQLEIYADDVKCTHGATVGQIDEDAVFYLRSRGISEEAARAMLIYAFAGESLERMKEEPIRAFLAKEVFKKLTLHDALRSVV